MKDSIFGRLGVGLVSLFLLAMSVGLLVWQFDRVSQFVPRAASSNQNFDFNATGFSPRERVNALVKLSDGREIPLRGETVNFEGNVRIRATSDSTWPAGTSKIIVRGESSGKEQTMDFNYGQGGASPPLGIAQNTGGRESLDSKSCGAAGGEVGPVVVERYRGGSGACEAVQCNSACCFTSCQCTGTCGAEQPIYNPPPASGSQTGPELQGSSTCQTTAPNSPACQGDKVYGECMQRTNNDGTQCGFEAGNRYMTVLAEEKEKARKSENPEAELAKIQKQTQFDQIETMLRQAAACKDQFGKPLDRKQCLDAEGKQIDLPANPVELEKIVNYVYANGDKCPQGSADFASCVAQSGAVALNEQKKSTPVATTLVKKPTPAVTPIDLANLSSAYVANYCKQKNVKGTLVADYKRELCYDCAGGKVSCQTEFERLAGGLCTEVSLDVLSHKGCVSRKVAEIKETFKNPSLNQLSNLNQVVETNIQPEELITKVSAACSNNNVVIKFSNGFTSKVDCAARGLVCSLGNCIEQKDDFLNSDVFSAGLPGGTKTEPKVTVTPAPQTQNEKNASVFCGNHWDSHQCSEFFYFLVNEKNVDDVQPDGTFSFNGIKYILGTPFVELGYKGWVILPIGDSGNANQDLPVNVTKKVDPPEWKGIEEDFDEIVRQNEGQACTVGDAKLGSGLAVFCAPSSKNPDNWRYEGRCLPGMISFDKKSGRMLQCAEDYDWQYGPLGIADDLEQDLIKEFQEAEKMRVGLERKYGDGLRLVNGQQYWSRARLRTLDELLEELKRTKPELIKDVSILGFAPYGTTEKTYNGQVAGFYPYNDNYDSVVTLDSFNTGSIEKSIDPENKKWKEFYKSVLVHELVHRWDQKQKNFANQWKSGQSDFREVVKNEGLVLEDDSYTLTKDSVDKLLKYNEGLNGITSYTCSNENITEFFACVVTMYYDQPDKLKERTPLIYEYVEKEVFNDKEFPKNEGGILDGWIESANQAVTALMKFFNY